MKTMSNFFPENICFTEEVSAVSETEISENPNYPAARVMLSRVSPCSETIKIFFSFVMFGTVSPRLLLLIYYTIKNFLSKEKNVCRAEICSRPTELFSVNCLHIIAYMDLPCSA